MKSQSMGPGKCICEEKILYYMINRADLRLFSSSSPESAFQVNIMTPLRICIKKGLEHQLWRDAYILVFIKSGGNFKATSTKVSK